jgi:hypothetical protein
MNSSGKLKRAFLWEGTNKVSGGKCKIKWGEGLYAKDMGVLGIPFMKILCMPCGSDGLI